MQKGHPSGIFHTVKSCRISEALFERPLVVKGVEMGLLGMLCFGREDIRPVSEILSSKDDACFFVRVS